MVKKYLTLYVTFLSFAFQIWLLIERNHNLDFVQTNLTTIYCYFIWIPWLLILSMTQTSYFLLFTIKLIRLLKSMYWHHKHVIDHTLKCYFDQNLTPISFSINQKYSCLIPTMPSFKSLCPREVWLIENNFWLRPASRPPAITKFKYGREQLRKLGREGSDVIQSRQQK